MGFPNIFKKKEKKDLSFTSFPHLKEIKPKDKYVFHSDYFEVDSYFCSILSFFHKDAAMDNFGAFWGINKIPGGLDIGVTTINIEQVKRLSEAWVRDHQNAAETVAEMSIKEQKDGGSNTTKAKAVRAKNDLEVIAQELNDGASYLQTHSRLLVKAPTLQMLDDAIQKIERLYTDRFGTLWAAPYIGEQRKELTNLFDYNRAKKGKGFYFTSTEYAGSYSLVTHGLEDPKGEYVGYMVGDVNNSAVLFNVNGFNHHCVVASEQFNETRGRVAVSDMWGSKLSQSCLLNNGKVAHILLSNTDLDKLGPKFESLTYKIDLNLGDVNMFEMFGEIKDEMSIFPAQMQKLILMAEQAYETTDSDRSIIRGSLEDIATKFYIENRMWAENAGANRDKLRIVEIPHEEVPKLQMFVTYLDTEYRKLVNSSARDEERLHAVSVLATTFKNLLSNNGDLFNTTTSERIDGAKDGLRVIYDFSGLMMRGKGIAMAQLVNIIAFAINNLDRNDLVIFHGAELIDPGIRTYINMQLDRLYQKGGRVAFCYNSMEKMLEDQTFNRFDKADYTIFGNMTENIAAEYQRRLGQVIPADLSKLITNRGNAVCYIRRDFDNVVFQQDLKLDPNEDEWYQRGGGYGGF